MSTDSIISSYIYKQATFWPFVIFLVFCLYTGTKTHVRPIGGNFLCANKSWKISTMNSLHMVSIKWFSMAVRYHHELSRGETTKLWDLASWNLNVKIFLQSCFVRGNREGLLLKWQIGSFSTAVSTTNCLCKNSLTLSMK